MVSRNFLQGVEKLEGKEEPALLEAGSSYSAWTLAILLTLTVRTEASFAAL